MYLNKFTNKYHMNYRRNQINRRRNHSHQHAINVHFDNISMLANIIQDSQRLLESSRYDWNPSPPQYLISSMYTPFSYTTPSLTRPFTPTPTPTPPASAPPPPPQNNFLLELQYNIQNVDASSNQEVFDMSGVELFDVSRYEYIENPTNDICPISRESFNQDQNVLVVGQCKHIFSKPSLQTWLMTNQTCPSCRRRIRSSLS